MPLPPSTTTLNDPTASASMSAQAASRKSSPI
jgi:hypothetical protein